MRNDRAFFNGAQRTPRGAARKHRQMENANPTAGDSGVTSADPIDRIEAFLAAEDGDTQQADPAPTAAKTPDKPEDGDHGKTDGPQFTTQHLAQFLGIDESMVDVDEEGQPVFKTKIDGAEKNAKFKDFIADYQKQGSADNRLREAAAKEQAAERRMQEAEQAVQAKFAEQQEGLKQVAHLAIAMQQDLNAEKQAINWDAYWQENPAAARAMEKRFEERQNRLNATMHQLATRDQHMKAQAKAALKSAEEKNREAQAKRLVELVPEWKDPAVFSKERAELLQWIEKSGVDTSDIDLNKASQVYLLRKTWQHDTLKATKPDIENKLRVAPKLVKPGTPAQAGESQSADLKRLAHQARQPGREGGKAVEAWLLAKGLA